jgi:immune inhibitor A
MSDLFRVPPSPEVMSTLYVQYLKYGKPNGLTFKQYLATIGFTDPAADQPGMDDNIIPSPVQPDRIVIPQRPVTGKVNVKVLLIDFPDREARVPAEHYRDLLFSDEIYPTGSLRDYYKEVSFGNVEIEGSVHGWLRMPQTYSFYTNNESGTNWDSYPRNAPRMAEDAVQVALNSGIKFDKNLDKFDEGIVTALFLVHAGRGAETVHPSISGREIWSHKWRFREPVEVGPGLYTTVYLTVPEDCKVGVCAHELGHLVFQWQDFYDPNYNDDGTAWDGSGRWDLMAGGSYNGNGSRPAHPAALHKIQHGWIKPKTIKASKSIKLFPHSTPGEQVIKIISKAYTPGKQYLLLENRTRQGFDYDLPGEGLLVWKVDEAKEMFSPHSAGLALVQADGQHDLESAVGWNQGDEGDPFPGKSNTDTLPELGPICTSFGDLDAQIPCGITIEKICYDPITKEITLEVIFK